MSYQPPPPPPGGGSPAKFDPKAVNPLDWGIIGAGVLAFLLSFISFYSSVDVSYTIGGREQTGTVDEGGSAWSDVIGGGFFAWFAMLFAIAGAAAVAIAIFAPQVRLPFPNRLVGLGLFAAASLFEIIAIFVTPGESSSAFGAGDVEASANHGFGFWASLIVILAGTALSLMRFQATGGQLPSNIQGRVPNVGGYGPQGGIPGGQPGPGAPGPGYPPPGSPPPPPPPSGNEPPPPPPGYGPPR